MSLNQPLVKPLATVLFVAVSTCSPASGQSSDAPSPPAQRPGIPAAADSYPCVLLKNDNVLFGHAQQVGEFVVVQTGEGGKVQLRRSEVACWAPSTRALYLYRVDHRQADDLTALIRDAKWCLRYDLFDLAAQEIKAIRAIDPNSTDADLLEAKMRRQMAPPKAYGSATAKTMPIQPVGFQSDDAANTSPDAGQFDAHTIRTFASQIQPMLLNRCGRCHGQQDAATTQWSLIKPAFGARASSQMTNANLAASWTYMARDESGQRPLLVKATTAHGGGPAPLNARNQKAIDSLARWLEFASRGQNASLPRQESRRPTNAPAALPTPPPVQTDLDNSFGADTDGPARLPQVANPFDPDLFNRRFHPVAAE